MKKYYFSDFQPATLHKNNTLPQVLLGFFVSLIVLNCEAYHIRSVTLKTNQMNKNFHEKVNTAAFGFSSTYW